MFSCVSRVGIKMLTDLDLEYYCGGILIFCYGVRNSRSIFSWLFFFNNFFVSGTVLDEYEGYVIHRILEKNFIILWSIFVVRSL